MVRPSRVYWHYDVLDRPVPRKPQAGVVMPYFWTTTSSGTTALKSRPMPRPAADTERGFPAGSEWPAAEFAFIFVA